MTDAHQDIAGVVERGPGHCADNDAWAYFCERLCTLARKDLAGGDMTDFALANHVFMADRMDLDLIGAQTAAKERIRWLSVQLAIALSYISRLEAENKRLVQGNTGAP